jgi:hypothetical protein
MTDKQVIPNEAVEAAKVAYLREFNHDENAEYVTKLILEAAAPYMMAEAWEEGREADDFSVSIGYEKNPYR